MTSGRPPCSALRRAREFGFLKKLAAAYPSNTAIKIILDNDSGPAATRQHRLC
jgi:hypothetical protein